jgi:nicotinamide-nucleotide amidase
MKTEIISVGTELLLGQIANLDAQIISEMITPLGIDMFYHTTVGDNSDRLRRIFRQALERSDVIFTTGGLGPTMDDLTKETIADELQLPMILNEKELIHLESMFTRRGGKMPLNNKKQAVFPRDSIIIPNNNGTAPGVIIEKGQKKIIILPGPPRELRPMMVETVIPYLLRQLGNQKYVIKSKVLKLCGIGESAAEEAIEDIIKDQSNPTIAPLAGSEVTFRITAKADNEQNADAMISTLEKKVRDRIGQYVYGINEESLESVVGNILNEKNWTIALAESCTGGLVSARLTAIPGSSAYFERGYVCYSNQSKIELLNVDAEILQTHGAVSVETALQMARGARKASKTDIGVSVTGIAGPGGGSNDKPVGYVCFGISTESFEETQVQYFSGTRTNIRNRAAHHALRMIWNYLSIRCS